MKKWWVILLGCACLTAHEVLARGGGGCFEAGTPVLTPHGNIPIEQLRIGDEVTGGRVEAVYRVEPVEYLVLPGGIHVTSEHPFQTAPGVFRTAERMFPGAPRLPADKPAYNLLVSPGGTYVAGGYRVHNKGCFLPDTPILRADHSAVAIREVRPGEQLLAFDLEGRVVVTTVRNIITHQVEEYLIVRTPHVTLRVTREHPFYVGDGTFKTLEALHVGEAVFAFDGTGLSAQPITGIEPVRAPTTVYNLQTDAPNTYFACGIAVHNKGGGGGGGGHGGGFGGGGFGRGMHTGATGNENPGLGAIMVVVLVVAFIFILKGVAVKDEDLDFCYKRNVINGKAIKTRKLLEFIARVDDAFAPPALEKRVRETFVTLQKCWQARNYTEMRPLLLPPLYADHCAQLNGLCRNHEINVINQLQVEQVDLVNVRYTNAENQREFTALITAKATDYYIDDRTRAFLRGDKAPAQFQEFWTFQRQDGQWLLREIEQSRESDALKEENFFEQFTDQGVSRVYAEAAAGQGEAGPWLDKQTELKATRIERLLNFLVQTDKLWDRGAMLLRARQTFLNVMLARQGGVPAAVPEDGLFPATATDLRQQIAREKEQGLVSEYRNLCVRKVELVHVRNCADNSRDEFTVRISAHAQNIVSRNGVMVRQDEYVQPFAEYWTFGRHGGQWKLKEVLPETTGKRLAAAENVDEDSSAQQLQWYYRQTRA